MSLAALVRVTILLSMALLLVSLGLRSNPGDASYLLRKPALLVRSVLAMNLIMPVLITLLVLILNLRPAVEVALVALSVSPVPPFLPDKMLRLTRHQGYVYGLLVVSTVLALILVPLATAILQHFELRREHLATIESVPFSVVAKIVGSTILLPLACGVALRSRWPGLVPRAAPLMSKAGGVLLILAVIPLLLSQGTAMISLLGDGTLLASIAFSAIGLLIGHTLGGPDPRDRTVLALGTASRHPAVALAVTSAVSPDQTLAPAAILLALLVGIFAAAPYSSRQAKLLDQAITLRSN
jgi:BASS family bile acid:Na+ symporter